VVSEEEDGKGEGGGDKTCFTLKIVLKVFSIPSMTAQTQAEEARGKRKGESRSTRERERGGKDEREMRAIDFTFKRTRCE
jgi:hypothetical protein